MMNFIKLAGRVAIVFSVCAATTATWAQAPAATAQSPWAQPAAELADKIAEILGPGQARLAIRNQSSIPADEIPAIRKLLEQDLKTHGVQASGAESANAIRVTLSENVRERLWVAEVIEGSETRVAMVRVDAGAPSGALQAKTGVALRSQVVVQSKQPVLAVAATESALVALEPEEIVIYSKTAAGWQEQKSIAIGQKRALARDPRGAILTNAAGDLFEAFVAGVECTGSFSGPTASATAKCRESDDPWPMDSTVPTAETPASIKAFYNAARNYFTGVVTPGAGADLPPFYSAGLLPRPSGGALLIGGIDGKVQMVENGALKPVSGTRDWGSDIAVLHSGCGTGDQVIASGSGEALSDSLRAYELPALEAIPTSAPLAMDGTVMGLWTAPDGKSVMASVRHASGDYEVDRVTALCD